MSVIWTNIYFYKHVIALQNIFGILHHKKAKLISMRMRQ